MARDLGLPLLVSCLFHLLVFGFPFCYSAIFHEGRVAAHDGGGPRLLSVTWRSSPDATGALERAHDRSDNNKPETGRPRKESSGEKTGIVEEKSPSPNGTTALPFGHTNYLLTDDLTIPPQPLGDPVLESDEIINDLISGTLVLNLWISEQGDVIYTELGYTDLPERVAETVEKAFRKLRFISGELNGKRVGAIMKIEIRYEDSTVIEY